MCVRPSVELYIQNMFGAELFCILVEITTKPTVYPNQEQQQSR